MRLPQELDEDLVELLRFQVPERVRRDPSLVLHRAELHGLTSVVEEQLFRAGVEPPAELKTQLAMRATAREMDHAARLDALGRIDEAFANVGLEAVVLKGCLFAERFYAMPSGRATSDTDLMVAEADLERATAVLASLGYEPASGPEEERFRREHHHIHLANPSGPPLELHFHAYRGFGSVLPSEVLIARRERFAKLPRGAVGVLAKPDELVYLAVHGAAHRFVRLGWLYDMRLIVERMTQTELESAAARARGWHYARLLAFTADILHDTFGISSDVLAALGRLGAIRSGVVRLVVGEPPSPLRRSATRFAYGIALCDTLTSAARYAALTSYSRGRALVWR